MIHIGAPEYEHPHWAHPGFDLMCRSVASHASVLYGIGVFDAPTLASVILTLDW